MIQKRRLPEEMRSRTDFVCREEGSRANMLQIRGQTAEAQQNNNIWEKKLNGIMN